MRKKQTIIVIAEPTVILHGVEELAPLKIDWVEYEGRKVLSLQFRAFNCYFKPGRQVAVNAQRNRHVPCFEAHDVLEIRTEKGGLTKNRLLCPVCHYASHSTVNELPVVGTRQIRHMTACQRKGCHGTSSYAD